MITTLALLVALALFLGTAAWCVRRAQGLALWLEVAALAGGVRVAALWLLLGLHWTDRLGLWATPLLLLLLPEGWLLPREAAWSAALALVATALVVAGSLAWSAAALAVLWLVRRARRAPPPPAA
jgi:hypothetical protein